MIICGNVDRPLDSRGIEGGESCVDQDHDIGDDDIIILMTLLVMKIIYFSLLMTSDYLINPSAAQLVEIIQSKVEFPQNWSNLRNKLRYKLS